MNNKRPRIVAIAPRGEVIRNFVYTGAFDEIAAQAHLTLLSLVPNIELEEDLRSRFERVLLLSEEREHRLVRMQREILDLAHGRWLPIEGT